MYGIMLVSQILIEAYINKMNKYTKSLSVAALLSIMSISMASAQATTSMVEVPKKMASSTMTKKKEMKAKKSHKTAKKMHTTN